MTTSEPPDPTLPTCELCHCVIDDNGECECGLDDHDGPDEFWTKEMP